jgi:parallel beta-helix repeat protein
VPKARRRSPQGRWNLWRWSFVLCSAGLLIGLGAALYSLDKIGITPRSLGPYIERRSDGHNALIEGIGKTANTWLTLADRGRQDLAVGAWTGSAGIRPPVQGQPEPGSNHGIEEVLVADSAALARAIAKAEAGQVITLLPGHYVVQRTIGASRPGIAEAPITVRAIEAGSVQVDIAASEGFRVSAPHWRFENLVLKGTCLKQYYCEHAFHVVGGAQYFQARNNLIVDFDAHFKVNAQKGQFPDHGLIEGNTLRNTTVRVTNRPVTPIDMVTVSHWVVRHNLISDFIKGDGDRISYGAFAKGGGSANVFEQNIIVCEDRLRGAPGHRIGLSLGGGGTGKQYCRQSQCITEQEDSILRSNLVASCSDDGIYLNAAARSRLLHNTLVDTGGVTVRFPESSADIDGNLVDGIIRSRDGGLLRLGDNLYSSTIRLYFGSHPQRDLFRAPLELDFSWRSAAARRAAASPAVPDLCSATRAHPARYGAFEDFSACLARDTGAHDTMLSENLPRVK